MNTRAPCRPPLLAGCDRDQLRALQILLEDELGVSVQVATSVPELTRCLTEFPNGAAIIVDESLIAREGRALHALCRGLPGSFPVLWLRAPRPAEELDVDPQPLRARSLVKPLVPEHLLAWWREVSQH